MGIKNEFIFSYNIKARLGLWSDSEARTPTRGTHSEESPVSRALATGRLDTFLDSDGLPFLNM